jgi:hypothetical protein
MRFHVYHFEPKTLSAMLAANGFEVLLTRYYVKTVSLKYLLGKAGIRIFGALFERVRGSFNTGDLFTVIARKV